MFPLKRENINTIKEDDLDKISELDRNGFLVAPGETLADYKKRLCATLAKIEEISGELKEKGEFTLFDEFTLRAEDAIPEEILDEASEKTEALYAFSIKWAPGFFLYQNVGLLWGGCAVALPDEHINLFLLRTNFAKKKRWFIYRRDELLAHELCHVARMPMMDRTFEEHFAYQTSPSAFRKYTGNCFRSKWDSILFLLPVLVLLVASFSITFLALKAPIWPFWLLAGAYPAFLLIRNHLARKIYFKAEKKLRESDVSCPKCVLFRSSMDEIIEIAQTQDNNKLSELIKEKAKNELRWKVIANRFFDKSETENEINGTD
jgi:hypothetical protein